MMIDPLELAREWCANDDDAPPLMTLGTVDLDGTPDTRSLLLSRIDTGFCFHTDARSAKVEQLARVPRASITVVWPERARQLTVQGVVERTDDEEADLSFRERSPYLQTLGHLNTAEIVALEIEERRRIWGAFADSAERLTRPADWIGFRLVPSRLAFWTGSADAGSTRREFRRVGASWTERILPG